LNSKAPVTIHIIGGPTAGGKSARALELARQKNGIVINCDSMQIYEDLPILTAQPPAEDKQAAPHVLYGLLPPNEICSAGIWQAMAAKEIETAFTNGQTPIICGGNGMYIKALMEGLSPMPDVPQEIRDAAVKKQQDIGSAGLHEELKKCDPESAARFHPQHTARIVRAWEVFEATGKKLSDWQKETKNAPPENWNFEIEKIMPEREELHRRCDTRFLKMLEMGALDEVKNFAAKIENGEIRPDVLLTKSLGFRPLKSHLEGNISLDEAISLTQAETRQYAKRQVTWFKNQM